MSNDDPFGRDGTGNGGDWGNPEPLPDDPNIDMNYGQPLPPAGQQPPQPAAAPQPGQAPGQQPGWGAPDGQLAPPPNNQLQSSKPKLDNNDVIALVLSVFFPGVGHMMLGQPVKGVAILIGNFLTCYGFGLLWIGVLLDAYLVAMTRKYRQLGDWEFFPDANEHLKT